MRYEGEERSKIYRSVLINRRSKMVYYVENDAVVVAGFWDCRRDPVAAAKDVKCFFDVFVLTKIFGWKHLHI